MTYEKALKEAGKVGASKAQGLPLLAQTCSMAVLLHAVDAKGLYDAAVRQGLTSKDIREAMKDGAKISDIYWS